MTHSRSTIYLLTEMGRQAGCSRLEAENALVEDCPEEAAFIRIVLDELYIPNTGPPLEAIIHTACTYIA